MFLSNPGSGSTLIFAYSNTGDAASRTGVRPALASSWSSIKFANSRATVLRIRYILLGQIFGNNRSTFSPSAAGFSSRIAAPPSFPAKSHARSLARPDRPWSHFSLCLTCSSFEYMFKATAPHTCSLCYQFCFQKRAKVHLLSRSLSTMDFFLGLMTMETDQCPSLVMWICRFSLDISLRWKA